MVSNVTILIMYFTFSKQVKPGKPGAEVSRGKLPISGFAISGGCLSHLPGLPDVFLLV